MSHLLLRLRGWRRDRGRRRRGADIADEGRDAGAEHADRRVVGREARVGGGRGAAGQEAAVGERRAEGVPRGGVVPRRPRDSDCQRLAAAADPRAVREDGDGRVRDAAVPVADAPGNRDDDEQPAPGACTLPQ